MPEPQTMQALLEAEAERWERAAVVVFGYSDTGGAAASCRGHAARLRALAAAMADRVVVRRESRLWSDGTCFAYLPWVWEVGSDTLERATAALQAGLTAEGHGWPKEEG